MVRCRLQCYCSAFASAAHGARRSSGAGFWMSMKHSGMANDCAFLLRLQTRIGGDVNFALTRLREQQGVLATPANDGPRRDPPQIQFPLISRAILTDLSTSRLLDFCLTLTDAYPLIHLCFRTPSTAPATAVKLHRTLFSTTSLLSTARLYYHQRSRLP